MNDDLCQVNKMSSVSECMSSLDFFKLWSRYTDDQWEIIPNGILDRQPHSINVISLKIFKTCFTSHLLHLLHPRQDSVLEEIYILRKVTPESCAHPTEERHQHLKAWAWEWTLGHFHQEKGKWLVPV